MEDVISENFRIAAVRELTQKLTGKAETDLEGLSHTAPSHFRRISDHDKVEVIQLLGSTACRISSDEPQNECHTCDEGSFKDTAEPLPNQEDEKLLGALEALHAQIERRPYLAVMTMEAYRRILSHLHNPKRLALLDSVAGKFALRMLRSVSRATRLKAAVLLQVFVRQATDEFAATRRTNCITILEYLQSMWQTNKLPYQEIVVIALVKFAEVATDDELNIILLRLVEYLGHSNVYIAALVASELLQLSHTLETNMQGLLRPFWRTISVVIVKNLESRPAIAQQVSDLVGMQMPSLLVYMEEHALPYLVLNGHTDLIRKIASSSASPMNAFEVCVKSTNMPKIFATLLLQAFQDPEDTIMKLLVNVSPDFAEHDLPEWLSMESSKIAFELLKAIGDAGHGKSSKAFQGFQLLAQLSFRKSSSSGGGRRGDLIPAFLENNALEIVTLFTSSFDDNLLREMNVERRRCLVALGELVKIGKGRINTVIPQICACLRSAMANVALCDPAYTAWISIISNIDEDDMAEILDQTLALTVRYWPVLNLESHSLAEAALVPIFKRSKIALRDCAEVLPSLKGIPQLSAVEDEIEKARHQKDELGQLHSFITRIQDENAVVAQSTLR